jgi:hypothetical protein
MKKKEMLVLAPVMACHEHSDELRSMLSFLESTYQFTVLDPLVQLSSLDNEQYYKNWQDKLSLLLASYDAFIGFSFGAVILQQCFPLFESQGVQDKPVVLISAPAFADSCLSERLGKVIELAQEGQLQAAYQLLMNQVLYPTVSNDMTSTFNTPKLACNRLSEGLTRVLTTDSRAILSTTSVAHYNFVGEQSFLVNQNHICSSKNGVLIVVPNAGMRVLQDNVGFCHQKIGEILL